MCAINYYYFFFEKTDPLSSRAAYDRQFKCNIFANAEESKIMTQESCSNSNPSKESTSKASLNV